MADETENTRKTMVININSQVESSDGDSERARLESIYGRVRDTKELMEDFLIHGFMAPFVSVTRKSDNQKGTMEFQDYPRFYFNFR